MDFSIRHTFAGITFKPNKGGTVRWATVKKILERGGVECIWYTYDDHQGSGIATTSAQAVLKVKEGDMLGPSRCYIGEHITDGNPRYAHKRFIRVRFHSNSFVTLYDLDDLEKLADGSEVDGSEVDGTEVDGTDVDEACQACVGSDCEGNPGDPPAILTKGILRLIVYNPDIS